MKTEAIQTALFALSALAAFAGDFRISPARAVPDFEKRSLASPPAGRIFAVGLTTGDFNRDGRLDFVVQTVKDDPANYLPFGAMVYIQTPAGAFAPQNEYILPTQGVTWDFVTCDANGDGYLDLLMEEADRDMLLLLGNRDGTFAAPTYLNLAAAGYFAVADFNSDGRVDIAAGKRAGGVGIFRGNGDGTFGQSQTLSTVVAPSYPRRGEVMAADLEGDGDLDLVVASVLNRTDGSGSLDVFVNGGSEFAPNGRIFNVGTLRGALGRLDNDTIPDYAGVRISPPQLEIWRGDGNGFAAGPVYSLGANFALPFAVKIADLNFDGIQDIVVSGEQATGVAAGPMLIFIGNGDWTFQPPVTFHQAGGAMVLNAGPVFADINRDGFNDILSLVWTTPVWPGPEEVMLALSGPPKLDVSQGFLLELDLTEQTGGLTLNWTSDFASWSPERNFPGGYPAGTLRYNLRNTSAPFRFYQAPVRPPFLGGH